LVVVIVSIPPASTANEEWANDNRENYIVLSIKESDIIILTKGVLVINMDEIKHTQVTTAALSAQSPLHFR
jgi:hypothetical protein